jgi:dolichol-phosphate mannosyltransferase
MKHRTIWIVLPAYNEEAGLPLLLQRIDESLKDEGFNYQVIVVDDGSTDRTAEVATEAAAKFPLIVESHAQNLGLGATLRDGILLACAKASDRDVLVTLDADNTHTPGLIARMVRSIREGHDVVIASRYRRGARIRGVPFHRRLLSRGASLLMITLFPIKGVRDYTCGYRAYDMGLLQRVVSGSESAFFNQDGFQVMVDILLKLRREPDVIFGEVPLILRYDHKEGASKMDVVRTTKQTLALMVRHRLRRG